jgi:hypothetical protein
MATEPERTENGTPFKDHVPKSNENDILVEDANIVSL